MRSKSPLQWVHVYKRCCVKGGWLAPFLVLARSHVPEVVGRNFLVGSRVEDQGTSERQSRF